MRYTLLTDDGWECGEARTRVGAELLALWVGVAAWWRSDPVTIWIHDSEEE